MLSDRLIRVEVVDRDGTPIPGAVVEIYIDGVYVGRATRSNRTYTVQINTREKPVVLKASYEGRSQEVSLAPNADEFTFQYRDVVIPVPKQESFWEKYLGAIIGVFFLIVTIVLVFVFPSPTTLQTRVIIATLSIAVGGIASLIPGMLRVNMDLGKRLVVSATGAIAVFVILYFFGPGP